MPHPFFLLIANPASGKNNYKSKLSHVSGFLKLHRCPFEIYVTEANTPELYLNSFLRNHPQFTDLILLGGDGTINLVINALPHFQYNLSFICNGTGNDSVKPLHLPKDLPGQMDIIVNGKSKKIDLGRCNGRYFMNGVGMGFDGEVVNEMCRQRNKKKGHWAYLSVVLQLMTRKWHWPVFIDLDGKTKEEEIFSITVSKGTTFGGGFTINPKAVSDDGLLDVCIFNKINVLKRCYVLPLVQLGKHKKAREVDFYKAQKLTIKSPYALKAHIDGEPFQAEKFEFEVIPQTLNVKAPLS